MSQELDSLGYDQHEPGAKLDLGKNKLDLVLGEFANALWEVGNVGTFGANKYTPRGWLSVPNAIERYGDALLRHYLAAKKGEDRDKDSDLLHLSHMAWNALAILELTCRQLQSTQKQQEQTSEEEQDPLLSHGVQVTGMQTLSDGMSTLSVGRLKQIEKELGDCVFFYKTPK